MIKVAFLIPSLQGGGQERVVSRLSQTLNLNFKLYAILFRPIKVYPFAGKIITLNTYSRIFFLKPFVVIHRVKKLQQLLEDKEINTVISFGESANLVNLLTPKRGKTLISIRQDI